MNDVNLVVFKCFGNQKSIYTTNAYHHVMNPKFARLGNDEESLLDILPDKPFMTRDVSTKYGTQRTVRILASLEIKGRIKYVGMTGEQKRYKLWEKI